MVRARGVEHALGDEVASKIWVERREAHSAGRRAQGVEEDEPVPTPEP
jgi:hypothetical protein